MNILQIIPALGKGGAESLVLNICNEITKNTNHKVKLIVFRYYNKLEDHFKDIDIDIVPYKYASKLIGKTKKDLKFLEEKITNFKPDIIHTHLWEAEIVSRQIKFTKAKWFSHFHDNMNQLRNTYLPTSKKDITDSYEKRIVVKQYKHFNNNFITVSNSTYAYAKKSLPRSLTKNIYLIPNAIDFNKFKIKTKEPKNKELKLINIGSFIPLKNQELAINILCELLKKNINTTLTLIGDGILKKKLIALCKEKKVSDKVKFIGEVSNVEEYLSQSDIYLHTSKSESFGLTMIEAMASKKPVVSLDAEGNRDFIKHGVNGYIINKQNIKIFCETIIALYKNRDLNRSIINNGYITAKEYDIKNYVSKLLELYKPNISETNCL